MEHETLTHQIIGCAYKVYNTLGAGFVESIYERALAIELARVGLDAQVQAPVNVFYLGQLIGEFRADIIVDDLIILELKAVEQIAKVHEVQLVNYLRATGKPVGLLVNFGPERVEVRRKVRELKETGPPSDPVDPVDPVILSRTTGKRAPS